MDWLPLTDPRLATQGGWSQEKDIDGVDPYAVWADATRFRRFGSPLADASQVPMLIQFQFEAPERKDEAAAKQKEQAQEKPEEDKAQKAQDFAISAKAFLKKWGVVWPAVYDKLLTGPSASIGAQVPMKSLKVMRSSSAPNPADFVPRVNALVSAQVAPAPANVPKAAQAGDLAGPVIAIIDDGCAFAHEHLRPANHPQGWRSRVRFLWDQGNAPLAGDPAWKQPAGFDYGRELDGAAIDALLAAATAGSGEIDEDACYAAARYDAVRPRASHGSVVTDLAAGAPDPLAKPGQAPDAAGEAPVIFVQLPRSAVDDPAGGGLHRYVLDALYYIGERSRVGGVAQRLVVNLSYGTYAGPHDGSSPVELAIDAFLEKRQRDCAVVVAAGNAHEAHIHANTRLPPGTPRELRWSIAPDHPMDSFMELWLPSADDSGQVPQVLVRLVPPEALGAPSPWIGKGQSIFGSAAAGALPVCGLVYPSWSPNGSNGTLALAAVAATQNLADESEGAPPGSWGVEVLNDGNAPVEVHAWIERENPSFEAEGRQSRFDDPQENYVSAKCTLGSYSHGANTIVVGGCIDDADSGRPPAPYSSEGPGRLPVGRDGPDVAAGCEQSLTVHGLLAAGTRSGVVVRLGGTSVAAPVVARRLFNEVVAVGPSKTVQQIRNALAVTPRGPTEGPGRVGRGRIKSLP